MGLFKVLVLGNPTRKAVCAETLVEVISKSLEKFKIDEGQYHVVLEDDGTEVDDDEVLHELAKNSSAPICLMLLPEGVSMPVNQLMAYPKLRKIEDMLPKDSTLSCGIAHFRPFVNETNNTDNQTIVPGQVVDVTGPVVVEVSSVSPAVRSSYDRNLWNTFPPRLMETVEAKKRASHIERLDLVKNIAEYMINTLRNTTRGTAVAISETICNKYPESFTDTVNGVIIGRGYESLLAQIVGAVNYRKLRLNKRPHSGDVPQDDDDERDSDDNVPKTKLRKEDEYGCVDYKPLLPEGETPISQEQKRAEVAALHMTSRGIVDAEVTKLMEETYPTQRENIIECSQKHGLTTAFFQRWPYLKNPKVVIDHASRLLGKKVSEVWSSKLTENVGSIRALMKILQSEKVLKAKQKRIQLEDTFISDHLKEAKRQARQVVRGQLPLTLVVFPLLINHFSEDQDYLFIIVKDDTSDESVVEMMPNAGPTLLIRGASIYDESATYSVMIDKKFEIGVPDILDGFLLTFLCYYVFGCCYPKQLSCTLEFIQRFFLCINPSAGKKSDSKKRKKTSFDPKVLKLINMLNA